MFEIPVVNQTQVEVTDTLNEDARERNNIEIVTNERGMESLQVRFLMSDLGSVFWCHDLGLIYDRYFKHVRVPSPTYRQLLGAPEHASSALQHGSTWQVQNFLSSRGLTALIICVKLTFFQFSLF